MQKPLIPPNDWIKIKTNKTHKGKATLRIIFEGLPFLLGGLMLERRRYQKNDNGLLSKALNCDSYEYVYICTANGAIPVNWENDFDMIFLQSGKGASPRAGVHYFTYDQIMNIFSPIENIINNCFSDRVLITMESDSDYSCVPEETESNHYVGMNGQFLYPQNPLRNGFIIQ